MPVDRIPTRWRPAAYRLRNYLLTDATAVAILGVGIAGWGIGRIKEWGPLSLLWLTLGMVCAVAPMIWPRRGELIGLTVGVMANLGLAFHSAISALIGGTPAGSPAAAHFSVVVLAMWAVWRGKRGDLPMPGEGRRGV